MNELRINETEHTHRNTVLVVQNAPGTEAGRVGEWLREAGLKLEFVRPYAGEEMPDDLGDRALMVLGGWMHPAEDDADVPWMPATRELTRQALERGTPMLGICLGGQLLAHTAGGTVVKTHGTPEYGRTPLRLLKGAGDDPLFGDVPVTTAAIEHHKDAITKLPPGAVWLARSADCRYQAFRVGHTAWGLQFHPEIAPKEILTWSEAPLAAVGTDRERLYTEAERDDEQMKSTWKSLADRFGDVVRQARATTSSRSR